MFIWSFSWCLRSVLWCLILSVTFRGCLRCLWPARWFACIFRLSPLFHRRFACVFSIRLDFNIDIYFRCLWSVLRLLSPLFYNRFNYCFYNWFNNWSSSWSLNWLCSWFLNSSLRSTWLYLAYIWLFIILLSSYSPF